MNTFAIGSLPVHFSVAKLFNFRWQYTYVKYADIGSPAFDETDLVYKWDGKLTGYDKRISATDAAELIKTSSHEFHSWLNSINALDKDQLGNPRSPNNREGSWCGN